MADERKKEKDWRQTPEPPGAARGGVVVDTVDLGAVIFRRYVWERLNSEHPEHHISFEDLGGSPHELENHNVKQAVEQLITITDNIRHNPGLQRLINQIEANCPHDVFMAVANSIFEDGINWGRIVSLFHLAFELIYRAITTDHKELIRPIISFVNEVISDLLYQWIIKEGGWLVVIRRLFPWCIVAIGAAMALVASLVYFRTTR